MASGIYQIRCVRNGQIYIGSSKRIATRWAQHRRDLRLGRSVCVYLQNAWTKHGEAAFQFSIVEECSEADLETREQHYIDELKPRFNSITDVKRRYGLEMRAKIAAATRARAALVTHCPKGHPYDDANTYRGKAKKRICRQCNAERVAAVYAAQSEEEKAARLERNRSRERNLEKKNEYTASHRAEKAEYDRAHRAQQTARKRERRLSETPEQREHRNALKRASYHRNKNGLQGTLDV